MAISYSSVDTTCIVRSKRLINAWICRAVADELRQCGQIAIVLCSDAYILETNRQFLAHDYLTDIITFDYCQGDEVSGDLVISIDTVRANADMYGVAWRDELHRVIIHGILHLIGYKDKSVRDAKLMRQKEDHYLALRAELGLI